MLLPLYFYWCFKIFSTVYIITSINLYTKIMMDIMNKEKQRKHYEYQLLSIIGPYYCLAICFSPWRPKQFLEFEKIYSSLCPQNVFVKITFWSCYIHYSGISEHSFIVINWASVRCPVVCTNSYVQFWRGNICAYS